MFDKRFKRIRIFTVLPGKAVGLDVRTPHGPLFMVGRGRESWKPAYSNTGERGMTCRSVGIGPLWAVYTRKRRPGHSWTVRAAETLNRTLRGNHA